MNRGRHTAPCRAGAKHAESGMDGEIADSRPGKNPSGPLRDHGDVHVCPKHGGQEAPGGCRRSVVRLNNCKEQRQRPPQRVHPEPCPRALLDFLVREVVGMPYGYDCWKAKYRCEYLERCRYTQHYSLIAMPDSIRNTRQWQALLAFRHLFAVALFITPCGASDRQRAVGAGDSTMIQLCSDLRVGDKGSKSSPCLAGYHANMMCV